MSAQFLLHQDGRWLSFEGDAVRTLDARPKVDRSTVVMTDFDGAVSDVVALEGSPAHAVALIEKRLRADGLIDNDSKILIHKSRTVGNGYQALFTAVPLDRWQQFFAWAESQPDHCLLAPSVAVLWQLLKPGRGVVLHSGRKFVFLAALRDSIVHASALAFSESPDDLAMTVAALGERAGRELLGGEEGLEPLRIEWLGALTPLAAAGDAGSMQSSSAPRVDPVLDRWPTPLQDDQPTERRGPRPHADAPDDSMTFEGQSDYANGTHGMPVDVGAEPQGDAFPPIAVTAGATPRRGAMLDEQLMEIFSRQSGTSVVLGPHTTVRDAEGARYRSAVPRLAQGISAANAVNSVASRGMYLAERLLPLASAASLVLAIGLGALGGRWTLAAHEARDRADALQAEIEVLDERVAALDRQKAIPAAYPELLKFIERATSLDHALDPHDALLSIRQAAGNDVRVLRLRLDHGVAETQTLRVDGVVNHGFDPGAQGQQVARFVQRLRNAGYVPVALDPQSGGSRAQAPGGSFSYQLTRAMPASGGNS